MNPYLTFRESDKNNTLQYYILQKARPHYLAVLSSHPSERVLGQAPVVGHNLWVVFVGTLEGINLIPLESQVWNEIQAVVNDMADWFYTERIQREPNKYKKWKNVPRITQMK